MGVTLAKTSTNPVANSVVNDWTVSKILSVVFAFANEEGIAASVRAISESVGLASSKQSISRATVPGSGSTKYGLYNWGDLKQQADIEDRLYSPNSQSNDYGSNVRFRLRHASFHGPPGFDGHIIVGTTALRRNLQPNLLRLVFLFDCC